MNVQKIKSLLKNAQEEVQGLRRKLKTCQMRACRYKQRINNVNSLISHIRQRKFISEYISESLAVS